MEIKGLCILDYDRFSLLSVSNNPIFTSSLIDPGPFMIIVDEAEKIPDKKNKINGVRIFFFLSCFLFFLIFFL